jgi:thiaminase/transcriptional activator TenA
VTDAPSDQNPSQSDAAQLASQSWSGRLWASTAPTYAAILAHPFLRGLTSGSLPIESFTFYLAQDAHYLTDYTRALMIVGAKAPTHGDSGMLARHAADAVTVELALHESLLTSLGFSAADLAQIPIAPTTRAYTSYLLAVAHGGTFAEGLAAVLPCYWIYEAVGRALAAAGSPDPRYQRWIEAYGDEAFAATVTEVLELTDRVGAGLSPLEAARAGAHFEQTARYEWMFWDSAWRQETWPI